MRDAAEHLKTKEDMAVYVACALEEGDPALITAALDDIACAQGMTKTAKRTGLGRESLYKPLSREGNPEFATVLKVFNSVGIQDLPAQIEWENHRGDHGCDLMSTDSDLSRFPGIRWRNPMK